LAAGSIHNWDEMATKLLKKFFPAHKTKKFRKEIQNFQQKDGDLFFEAWEHFNGLLLKCPHHNVSQDDQVQAFHKGLNDSIKGLVDLACSSMLMEKSSDKAMELFDILSENSQQFPSIGKQGIKGKGTREVSTNGRIQTQTTTMKRKLDMIVKVMTTHNIDSD
jgi:hypothetical protein